VTGSPPLIVIAGATATGKTTLAIELGEQLQASGRSVAIISADSRQVYRGLDIGTAKVTAADRARVPHHGLDLVDLDEPFTVVDFVDHAHEILTELGARDGVAVLVGGTGLYLRAVARGLDTRALPRDPEVRAALERDLESHGLPSLVDRLIAIAPGRASRIDLANPRRVVRAVEIATLHGDGSPPALRGYDGRVAWIGLELAPATNATWIAARARAQFDAGLIEEAAALRARYDPTLPPFSAIGYREAWAVLDGEIDRETAIDRDVQRNIAFAKRQRTWFRSEPDIAWLDAGASDLLATATEATRPIAGS
jgi:tRNA dimethylallyltransferase